MKLYPFQETLHAETYDFLFEKNNDSVLTQLGTGGGKSVLAGNMFRKIIEDGGRAMILVHRKEIVGQLHRTFLKFGIPNGIILPGYPKQLNLPMQVGSVQTYKGRIDWDCDMIAFDEAHHAKANTYLNIRDRHKDAKFWGITATPTRLDGRGFNDIFQDIICGPTTLELEQSGFLTPAEVYINPLDANQLRKVGTIGGDYNEAMLADFMDNGKITADIVEAYQNYANGKRAIVFATSVNHSRHIAERFNKEGVPAAHIESNGAWIYDTVKCCMVEWKHKEARAKIIEMLTSGVIKVVTNVEIATEGTDIPGIECVIMARPTKSLSLYLQMSGRGSRIVPGKLKYILLDCANNVLEHGLPNEVHNWSDHFFGLVKKQKKKKVTDEKLFKITLNNGQQEVLTLEEIIANFPKGVKGLQMERIDGVFRINLFNECMQYITNNGFQKGTAYYRFCDILRERNSYPNYMELLAIAKKLGHKQGWAWYEWQSWQRVKGN